VTRQLLVVGSMRSGTTLLNRLLAANPAVAMVYHPTRFFESAQDLRDLGPRGFLEKFQGAYGYFGKLDAAARARSEAALGALPEDAPKGEVYGVLLAALAGKPEARVVGEKYAGRGAEMHPFRTHVPDGKILMIVRDPRDVLLSNKKRIEQEADMDNYWAGAHLMALDDWAELAVLHRSFEQIQGGNYLQVRYEDLVAQPEQVLRQVCDFVGVPFAPEMTKDGALRHDDGREWRANTSHGEAYTSVSGKSVGAWRAGLGAGELLCLQAVLREHMRMFGYAPDPPVTESDALVEACNTFLAMGRVLVSHAVPNPRLYNPARSEGENLGWFAEKLVAACGLDPEPFLKGFVAGRAVTVKSAEIAMQPVAAEIATLRRQFEWHAQELNKEVRNVRAAVDRLPTFLNVFKRMIRKPPA
jgi:Sulfotransferase family